MLINRKNVMLSIWLMLPVSMVIGMLLSLAYGGFSWVLLIPFFILTYGAFVWVPSIIFTNVFEYCFIDERASEQTVAMLFGFETLITFFVILFTFGVDIAEVAFLALIMSVIIQLFRWGYLKRKGRMYVEPKNETKEECIN